MTAALIHGHDTCTIVKLNDKTVNKVWQIRALYESSTPKPQVGVKLDRTSENLSGFINLEFDFGFISHFTSNKLRRQLSDIS